MSPGSEKTETDKSGQQVVFEFFYFSKIFAQVSYESSGLFVFGDNRKFAGGGLQSSWLEPRGLAHLQGHDRQQ